jgi:hypothetical protein
MKRFFIIVVLITSIIITLIILFLLFLRGNVRTGNARIDENLIDLSKEVPITKDVKIKQFGVGYAVKGYASLCKQIGVNLVRIPLVAWGGIEKEPPKNGVHHYNWERLDEIIKEYQENGFNIQIIIKAANPWACKGFAIGSEKYRLSSPPKEQYWDDYYAFVYNLVERYDGDGYEGYSQLQL